MTKFVAVRVTVEKESSTPGPYIPDAWLQRAGVVVTDYWRDMSGGRELVEWSLHGDVQLKMTQDEKQALSAADLVTAVRDAAAADGQPFAALEHLVVVMNDPGSGVGICVTDPIVRALDVDVAIITHEMGHFYQHANKQPGSHANMFNFRTAQYADNTCIMGAEGAKFSFQDGSLTLPGFPGHEDVGPAMSPPMTTQTGWLELGNPDVAVDFTHRLPIDIELKTWAGAPAPGYRGRPVVLFGEGFAPHGGRIYLSLRSPSSPWDAAFPVVPPVNPGDPPNPMGSGMVVAQELTSNKGSLLITNCAAVPRASMRLGRAPLRVDVLDLTGEGAVVRVSHDPWRAWRTLRSPELHEAARIAAVARGEAIDAFVVARDGIAYGAPFRQGVWRDWVPLTDAGFSPTAGIAAAAPGHDTVDVFVVGLDDQVRRRRRVDDQWSGWDVIDGGNLDQDSCLAATATGPDRVELVASDRDGRVVHTTVVGGVRGNWNVLPELRRARSVAAEALGDGIFQVHAVSEGADDSRLWSIDNTNGVWDAQWTLHSPETFSETAGIAAASPVAGSAVLVAAANPMLVRTFDTGLWLGQWTYVDGTEMSDTSTVAAVSRNPSSVDVLAIGRDAQVHVITRSLDPNAAPATRQVQDSYLAAFISSNQKFLSAQPNGSIFADRTTIGRWEIFNVLELEDASEDGITKTLVAVQSHTGQYLCAESGGGNWLLASRGEIGDWELFKMFSPAADVNLRAFRALGGHLWCAEGGGDSWVNCNRINVGPWESFRVVKLGE